MATDNSPQSPWQRIIAFWNSGTKGKLVIIVGGLGGLAALCCAGTLALGAVLPEVEETPTAVAAAPSIPADTPTATPTATHTATPTQTYTPEPTDTPEPTSTPTPTPEPIALEGFGQDVVDFTMSFSVGRAVFTHNGGSNFIVTAFGPGGSEDLLVNEIGYYEGSRPLFGEGDYTLEIDADGAWTALIEPIVFDNSLTAGLEGKGDYVSDVFMPLEEKPTPYTFLHDGSHNFIVYLHCAGGSDLIQNEIGAVDATAMARFSEGPCLWDVIADGAWSIRPRD
jgi:hypothetical protein